MIAEERFAEMIEYLDKHGSARIGDLAEMFGVSEMTIHRDLNKAADMHLIEKVHGGAVSRRVKEIPYRDRSIQNKAAKQVIAQRALELVREGMTIFLAPGTTITEFARILPNMDLRIITNSLPIAQELTLSSRHEIRLTGGTVRRHAEALVGAEAEATPGEYFIHLAFLSPTGVDIEQGLTVYSESEARVLKAVIKSARKTVMLTDTSKYETVMGPVVAPLYAVHVVGSEAEVPDRYRTYFEANDIQLLVGEGDSPAPSTPMVGAHLSGKS